MRGNASYRKRARTVAQYPGLLRLAKEVLRVYDSPWWGQRDISIFLCGGKKQKAFRNRLRDVVPQQRGYYRYRVFYPEDMFMALIFGNPRSDLLQLEHFLATKVHAIVILLQSAGTFTELGAFAAAKGVRDKLLVVTYPRYARDKSFINIGPLRYLTKNTKSLVLKSRMEQDPSHEANRLAERIREFAK